MSQTPRTESFSAAPHSPLDDSLRRAAGAFVIPKEINAGLADIRIEPAYPTHGRARRIALIVCGFYAAVSALGMLSSDLFVAIFSSDAEAMARMQKLEGWIFVCISGMILYFVLQWQLRLWQNEAARRRKAESGLQLMHDLVNHARDAVFVMGLETEKPLGVNATACRERGYTMEEMLNMTLGEISSVVNPNYTWKMHVENIRANGGKLFYARHKRKDGSTFPVEASSIFIEHEGKTYLVSTVRDISEREKERAEADRKAGFLQALADATSDVLFVKDREGRYLFCNEAAAKFSELSIAEVVGKTDAEIFDPRSAATIMERDRRVILSGRAVVDEVTLTYKKGATRAFLINKAPYRDERNEIIGLVGIARDITERISIEEGLREIGERYAANEAIRKLNVDLERQVDQCTG